MGCANSVQAASVAECIDSLDRFERGYDTLQELGRGAFGTVYSARERVTGSEIAVKIIDTADKRRKELPPAKKRRRAMAEIEMWSAVGEHPSIVQLRGSFCEGDKWYILMEKCECTVPQKLEKDQRLFETGLPKVLQGMLQGLAVCHAAWVVHRDIKLENFLMGMDGETVKLCDFGLSRRLPPPPSPGLRGAAGTAPMMSPEMVCGDPYGTATDVWSYGAMVYLVMFQELPYMPEDLNRMAAKEAIKLGKPSPRWLDVQCPQAAFLRPLLERDPRMRWTAEQALQHRFLKDPQPRMPADPRSSTFTSSSLDISSVQISMASLQGSLLDVERINNGSLRASFDGNEWESDDDLSFELEGPEPNFMEIDPADPNDPNNTEPNNI